MAVCPHTRQVTAVLGRLLLSCERRPVDRGLLWLVPSVVAEDERAGLRRDTLA